MAVYDEDVVDLMVSSITPLLMWSLSLVFFLMNYRSNAIDCWPDPEWNNSLIRYASGICSNKGTFIVPKDQPLPKGNLSDDYQKLNYYQWVPFIFLFMGIAAMLPLWFWRSTSGGSYFDTYCKTAVNTLQVNCKESELLRFTADLEAAFANKWFSSRRIFISYMIKKLLNIFVIVLLIKMLSCFIAENPHDHFGIDQLNALLFGQVKNTTNFPMTTACEVDITEYGFNRNITYSSKVIECELPRNGYLQEIYVFLWFWLASLFIVSVLNGCWWLWDFRPSNIKEFIWKKLIQGGAFLPSATIGFQEYWVTKLSTDLPLDGLFLLKMVDNKTQRIAPQITSKLFEFKLKDERQFEA